MLLEDAYLTNKSPAKPKMATDNITLDAYTVTAGSLNLRTQPSTTKGSVITSLSKGTVVYKLSEPTSTSYINAVSKGIVADNDGNWMYVNCPSKGQKGWVYTAYVTQKQDGTPCTIIVSTSTMYSQPSITSAVRLKIPKGNTVYKIAEPKVSDVAQEKGKVIANDGTWVYVRYNGVAGWIKKTDISASSTPRITSAATVSTVPTVSSNTQAATTVKYSNYGPSIVYNKYIAPVDEPEMVNQSTLPTEFNLPPSYRQYDNMATTDSQRSKMIIHTYDKGQQKWLAKIFEFIIGPSAYTETLAMGVTPIKTGAGYILRKSGPEPNHMSISGYLLDTKETDERRKFLDDYYTKYILDSVNAFHEYFNQNRLILQMHGYEYKGTMLGLTLTKSAQSLYLYSYNMEFIVSGRRKL